MSSDLAAGLEVVSVPESRFEEALDFIYKEFFPREVLAIASGLDRKTNPGTTATFLKWLHQGLSVAIVDKANEGRIAGLALNCLLEKSEIIMDHSCLEWEDRVIWTLLDRLETGYNIFEEFGTDRGMELVFLCVHPDYCGRGLARILTERTIAVAREQGMPFLKSNPACPATVHLYESLGFDTISQSTLVDFQLDGKPGFPNAKPDDKVRLSVKRL